MTDKEIALSLELIEEQVSSKVDRLDSKIERVQSDFVSYKEAHSNEHDHNENEVNLKLDLINHRIVALQEQYVRFEKKEQDHETKSLSMKQLLWSRWSFFGAIIIFILANFFNINYESIKKSLNVKEDTNTTVQRDKQ